MIPISSIAQPSGKIFYLDFIVNGKKIMTFTVPIWIGKVDQDVRLWLDDVQDSESYDILSIAANKFVEESSHQYFNIKLVNSYQPNQDVDQPNQDVEVRGKLTKITLIAPNRDNFHAEFEIEDIARPLGFNDTFVTNELKHQGYFYFTGEFDSHDEKGQKYDVSKKIFRHITKHIIDSAVFTGLYFYYDRSKASMNQQHLLP